MSKSTVAQLPESIHYQYIWFGIEHKNLKKVRLYTKDESQGKKLKLKHADMVVIPYKSEGFIVPDEYLIANPSRNEPIYLKCIDLESNEIIQIKINPQKNTLWPKKR